MIPAPTHDEIMAQINRPWPAVYLHYLQGAPFRSIMDLAAPREPKDTWNPVWNIENNPNRHPDAPIWAHDYVRAAHMSSSRGWVPAQFRRGHLPPELNGLVHRLPNEIATLIGRQLPANLIWPDINPVHYVQKDHRFSAKPRRVKFCFSCGAPMSITRHSRFCPECARKLKRDQARVWRQTKEGK